MGLQEMLQWWNLIYVAPLLVSLIWILAAVMTGAHGGDATGGGHGMAHGVEHAVHGMTHGVEHAIHDLGHSIGHMFGHADAGHGAGAHGDIGHVHAHANGHVQGHDSHGDSDTFARLMAILGVGQVPITMLIGIFLLCWGAVGLIANRALAAILVYPAAYIWPSIGIALAGSLVFTRVMAALFGRLMPAEEETYGVSRFELVGFPGRTVFTVTETGGTVDIRDQYGTVHRVQARLEPGSEAIPSGSDIIAVDFDEEDKRYIVKPGRL